MAGVALIIVCITSAFDSGEKYLYIEGNDKAFKSLIAATSVKMLTIPKPQLKTDDKGWYKRMHEELGIADSDYEGQSENDCFILLIVAGLLVGFLWIISGIFGFLGAKRSSSMLEIIVFLLNENGYHSLRY